MQRRNKKIAMYALLVALAFIFSYVEAMLPGLQVPGVKLGLANIVVLMALETTGFAGALIVSLVRVVLSALIFKGMLSLIYSLAGAIISLLVMTLLKKLKLFTIVGISCIGGIVHNMAQLSVACLMLGRGVIAYLPWLFAGGVLSGLFIGVIGAVIVKRVQKAYSNFYRK